MPIPDSPVNQKIKLYSNGIIGLEPESDGEIEDEEVLRRVRRSAIDTILGESSDSVNNDVTVTSGDRPQRKNVETLVVVDRDMIENHERDHTSITTYVLTVMNMVRIYIFLY